MNTNEIIEKSVYIITEYYKNNTQPFFDNIDDDILWIGPAENQILRGKANILSAWSNESHSLTFTMSDITTIPIRCSATVFEIVLIYHIYTHYPMASLQFISNVCTIRGLKNVRLIRIIHISANLNLL